MSVTAVPLQPTIDGPSYLTLAAAAALLAQLASTQLASYRGAGDGDKQAALIQATAEVDAAGPWQGRRYAANQALEFPRVPAETYVSGRVCAGNSVPPAAIGVPDKVWDWDATTQSAVVPRNVLLAVLLQADAILSGELAQRLDAQHAGLASQSVGGLSESYVQGGDRGREQQLVRRAADLMRPYRLRAGRLL